MLRDEINITLDKNIANFNFDTDEFETSNIFVATFYSGVKSKKELDEEDKRIQFGSADYIKNIGFICFEVLKDLNETNGIILDVTNICMYCDVDMIKECIDGLKVMLRKIDSFKNYKIVFNFYDILTKSEFEKFQKAGIV